MNRTRLLLIFLNIGLVLVLAKLFYWQVVEGETLKVRAERQHFQTVEKEASRGKIFTSDLFPLATNQPSYLLYALPKQIEQSSVEIANHLSPIILPNKDSNENLIREEAKRLQEQLDQQDLTWVALAHNLSEEQKNQVESLNIAGIGFEEQEKRAYPEASIAAHLLGFVGADESGKPQGYYGLEGFYQRSLSGRAGKISFEKDAWGQPILLGSEFEQEPISGSSLILNLQRPIQFLLEQELNNGIERYQAKAGSAIVIDPKTGGILAMVSYPSFDLGRFKDLDPYLFVNPVVSQSFEPGSIFKIVVMAAALDQGAVTLEDKCLRCGGPRIIGEHTIRTWNDKYYPDSTMAEILQHSDNVGMVYVGEKLTGKNLIKYLKKFGFGQKTNIDLEGEMAAPLKPESSWYEIDYATVTFGQGIAVTPIQMVIATAALANQGKLLEPQVVSQVNRDGLPIIIEPKVVRQAVSPTTAELITEMMVNAVDNGEAKWAKPKGFQIAGKTGTAQIPVAGHYDEAKTVVSFVGFAPAKNPKFVMLVTLREPQVSPWGSETAAPLWFDIARKLFAYWGIGPG